MRKIKYYSIEIFTVIFLIAVILLFANDLLAQKQSSLERRCAGASPVVPFGKVEVEKDGDIILKPCNGKSIFVNGSPLTGILTSLNGLTGATQTFAIGAADTAAFSSATSTHTLNLPITSISGSSRTNYLPYFTGANTFGKSYFQQDTGAQTFNIFPTGGFNISGDLSTETFGVNGTFTGFTVSESAGLGFTGVSRFSGVARFVYTAATPISNAIEIRDASNSETGTINAVNNSTIAISGGNLLLTAIDGVYIGTAAGQSITSGNWNTLIGRKAGQFLTTGTSNTAVGRLALSGASFNGSRNAAFGQNTGQALTTGTDNTFIGSGSADAFTTGSFNTTLGANAGALTNGSSNIFIGYLAGFNRGSISNQLFIDNSSTATPLIFGDFSADYIKINGKLLIPLQTPASASDTCTAGQITFDANYVYTCVATDTWKRVATATW